LPSTVTTMALMKIYQALPLLALNALPRCSLVAK
jgi:hypothetical protein